MSKINQFDWFYQVGNIVMEDGMKVLTDIMFVSTPEEAERLVQNNKYTCALRFRCDKTWGMVDREWYDAKTRAWI
jgi:hypothetical protein